MITLLEEIANLTTKEGRPGLEFGRIRLGDIDRYFFRIRGEFIALKEETVAQFLDKIEAYGTSNNTLFGENLKRGVSTGKLNTSQHVEKHPPEHTPVRCADFTRGA